MTELSFLIDLLLNHRLGKATKDLIAMRIKELGSPVITSGTVTVLPGTPLPQRTFTVPQAASTIALMTKHGDIPPLDIPAPAAPEPVTQIAHTAAAAAAMQARNESINAALSGKVDKVSGKPRKW